MPYTVRFHDVDYGNGGSVRTGVLGSFVTKKIANNAARDHFAGWSDEFAEYEVCDIGDPYHEEYVDGMIDIDAFTPEGLAMRSWVERSASNIKKRKPEGSFSPVEFILKSEDTDYRNPRGAGQYDVRSNMQGPYETEEEAIMAARNHLRTMNTAQVQVRDYTEDKTQDGMIMIMEVAGEVNVKAWVEMRQVKLKHSKPASLLPQDATACPFCGRSAALFPTGQAGLSRHVRLCPQKANGRIESMDNALAPIVVPSHEPQLPQHMPAQLSQITQQIPQQQLPTQQLPHPMPQLHHLPSHIHQTPFSQQMAPVMHHLPQSTSVDQSLLASNYLMSAAASLAAPATMMSDHHNPYTSHDM